jgi:hemoglobin
MSTLPTPPLTEDHLAKLVQVFYERARAHPELGKLFSAVVTDWDHHLGVVHDFWSHALLGTQRYKSHPYPAHVGLPIQRDHFDQWLALFRQAALETLPEEAATRAIARAEHMAESFRAGLFPLDPIRRA